MKRKPYIERPSSPMIRYDYDMIFPRRRETCIITTRSLYNVKIMRWWAVACVHFIVQIRSIFEKCKKTSMKTINEPSISPSCAWSGSMARLQLCFLERSIDNMIIVNLTHTYTHPHTPTHTISLHFIISHYQKSILIHLIFLNYTYSNIFVSIKLANILVPRNTK